VSWINAAVASYIVIFNCCSYISLKSVIYPSEIKRTEVGWTGRPRTWSTLTEPGTYCCTTLLTYKDAPRCWKMMLERPSCCGGVKFYSIYKYIYYNL